MELQDLMSAAITNSYLWPPAPSSSSSPGVSLYSSDCGNSSSDADEESLLFPKNQGTIMNINKNRPFLVTDLPPEIMEAIFRYLPFETVAKIRLVCHHFNTIGSSLLNSEFHRLRIAMQHRFQNIKSQMPRRESARRKHPLARESDIIETLHMRLTLLHMTFAKHIERKHCCFFAGEILDEVYRILRYVKTTPTLSKAYKVTDELFDLSTMAMEYFKEHIEPSLPEITYFGTEFFEYAPSLASSPKLQVSLLDEPSSSSSCPSKPPSVVESLPPPRPAVGPVVNKRLRKLRENMKRNNGQVNALKQDMKVTKRKVSTQMRQMSDLKARFDDLDKKFVSTSRKLNAALQELSHCRTELHYWRSKSPAAQCSCGKVTPILEIKELDNASVQAPFNDAAFQSDSESKSGEDFKPILMETEASSTDNNYFVVIPECRSTPSPNNNLVPSLAPPKRSKVKTLPKTHDDTNIEPVEEMSRGCKRKLDLEQDDGKLFVKALFPHKKKLNEYFDNESFSAHQKHILKQCSEQIYL